MPGTTVGGGETRGGSSPPFGTIAITKGNPVLAGFPFSLVVERVAEWHWERVCGAPCG
jgi:hypothetical protein